MLLAQYGISGVVTSEDDARRTGVASGTGALEHLLAGGHKVIVGLNAELIWASPSKIRTGTVTPWPTTPWSSPGWTPPTAKCTSTTAARRAAGPAGRAGPAVADQSRAAAGHPISRLRKTPYRRRRTRFHRAYRLGSPPSRWHHCCRPTSASVGALITLSAACSTVCRGEALAASAAAYDPPAVLNARTNCS